MGGGVPGTQASQSGGQQVGANAGANAYQQMPTQQQTYQQINPGTGKYGGMANQSAGMNPFQQFQSGQGLQQMGRQAPQAPQYQQQPFQPQQYQQQPFQGQQPNYAALLNSLAGMFGGQQRGAPSYNYQPTQSANNFQLRNTYQFDPATDPSRRYAAQVQAEAERKAAADAAAAAAEAAARANAPPIDYANSGGGAGSSGVGGGGADGEAGGAGGDGGGGGGDGAGGYAQGGHVTPDKKIRAALLTAKGVQAKAMPTAHGMDTVHTVIDPATVDHPAAAIPGVHLRAGRMGKAGGGDVDYRGEHTAPGPESGAPLHDLSGVYPDDFYSSKGFKYYADMGEPHDLHSYNQAIRARGNPEAPVWIYRAVPANVYKSALKAGNTSSLLGKGDWVTTSKQYAIDHGEHSLGGKGKYNVASKRVKAKDIYTSGDSIHEWGYHPQKSSDDAPGKAGGGALAAPGALAPEEEDSITAYHGSPHSFEEFDPKYIGTGEGAQAFGHGLYFAGDEGIAKHYRDTLSNTAHNFTVDDVPLSKLHGSLDPLNKLKYEYGIASRHGKAPEEALDYVLAQKKGKLTSKFTFPEDVPVLNEDIKLLEGMRGNLPVAKQLPGHMYEVRLKARPEHFLDWDKPLSDQHPHVIAALQMNRELPPNTGLNTDKTYSKTLGHFVASNTTGKDVVYGNPDAKNLSERLSAAGIRGIRYLDAGSRSQGEGTHNYVVFDPKHIEVARKYEDGGRVGYADGGGDDPVVQKALGLTRSARKRGVVPLEERQQRQQEQGFEPGWYHGSERIDRIVSSGKFDPKRATSGPMAFFTNNPQLASSYAEKKVDTSLRNQNIENVGDYFTVHPKHLGWNSRTPIAVERSWNFLPHDVKQRIAQNAMRVGYENPDEGEGEIIRHPEGVEANLAPDHYRHLVKEHRGNHLAALRDLWHDSGSLIGQEEKLKQIYELVGYPHPISDENAPWYSRPGVVPVALKMQNPLNTSDIDYLKTKVIPHLENAFKRDRTQPKQGGVDMWDKNTRYTPKSWVQQLKEDVEGGRNSYVWTSIPDKVTDQLRALGHDAILDKGGKGGTEQHDVAIPFAPTQVRSVFANYDPKKMSSSDLGAKRGALIDKALQLTRKART